jgi:hypothetical protein
MAGEKPGGWLRFRKVTRTVVIVSLLVLALAVYWGFFREYSSGERTGVLVKIAFKGNVFRTHEGELWLSCRQVTNPEKFYFSVTSDSIAKELSDLQDECVDLQYIQYHGSLPWRGDSKYIVTGVSPIRK